MKRGLKTKGRTIVFSCLFFLLISASYIDCRLQYPQKITIFEGEQLNNHSASAYSLSAPVALGGVLSESGNVEADTYDAKLSKNDNGGYDMTVKLFGIIPVRSVTVDVQPETSLVPCGNVVGIKIFTKGLVCVGTQEIKGENGKRHDLSRGADIRSGDIFLTANDTELTDTEQMSQLIEESQGEAMNFTLMRNGETITKQLQPIKTTEGFKLGLWLRDSTAGIGTLTFYNPKDNSFGALGHPIIDSDTETIMPVSNGALLPAKVLSIQKGAKGEPGELKGIFKAGADDIGNITKNDSHGIFGYLTKTQNEPTLYPVASGSQVKEGPATILANIEGESIESYSIEIQKNIPFYTAESKDMIIHVTDHDLLEKTGGIVQGMSGSPIIQNGRIVGAVTHVFVNDPTRGYGIFIENMLTEAEKIK